MTVESINQSSNRSAAPAATLDIPMITSVTEARCRSPLPGFAVQSEKPRDFVEGAVYSADGDSHSRHPVRVSPPSWSKAVLEFLNCNRICLNRF
jgi:hypothetical protein